MHKAVTLSLVVLSSRCLKFGLAPVSAARFGAAQDDHRLGSGQQILRPVALGRRAEGLRIRHTEGQRAAFARGVLDPGLEPLVSGALDIVRSRCAHFSFLS